MTRAYYNEFDKNAAAWLRELIKAGHIAAGDVDERSIEDVLPNDLAGYTQCHFFAGIGVWSHALRQAGWPDDRPVWTGSCPCQPFSAAGKGAAFDDERHLWPAFHHLIKERRPVVVLGEQVASKDADAWIDLVQDDLEGLDYAFGAVAFPSAGVGAPHIRDRTYWAAQSGVSVANTERACDRGQEKAANHGRKEANRPANRACGCGGSSGGMADSRLPQCESLSLVGASSVFGTTIQPTEPRDVPSDMGTAFSGTSASGPVNGRWSDADWLFCRDGKWRPVEPGTSPLVNGAAARVVRLRGYGNAINAVAAQTFIEAFMECCQ